MAVTVQADRPQITIQYNAWQLWYRRTGHRTQYYTAHGSYGTDGKATDHNIIQRMALRVQAERSQITI